MSPLLKFKKLLASLLLAAIVLPLVASPTRAFDSGSGPEYMIQFWNAVFETDEMNLQSFVFETIKAVGVSLITLPIAWLNNNDGPIGSSGSSLMIAAQPLSLFYAYPPASGKKYLALINQKLDLVPSAYAQSVGFERMDAIIPIWKTFRNISYMLMIILLIALGFAIMFRIKISPQAVITIQVALPRLIFSLVLITFSYAIVGFMIDLMYVLMNIIMSIMNSAGGYDLKTIIDQFGQAPEPPIVNDAALLSVTLAMGAFSTIFGIITLLIAALSGWVFPAIGWIVLVLVVSFVLLIALIRVLWTLLKAYVNIVLAIIFAPLQILAGAFPGSKAIGSWFTNVIANIMVWPTVFVMLYISAYLVANSLGEILTRVITVINSNVNIAQMFTTLASQWISPDEALPIILSIFIAIGVLILTPRAADMVKAFIVGQSFNYGTAIGEPINETVKYQAQRRYQKLSGLKTPNAFQKTQLSFLENLAQRGKFK